MSPGLFLGWRIDPGLRYRGVLRVLDYQEYRTKKNALAVDVPQEELFVEPGPPCFPIAFARDKALREGRDSSVSGVSRDRLERTSISTGRRSCIPIHTIRSKGQGGLHHLRENQFDLRKPQDVRDVQVHHQSIPKNVEIGLLDL